MEDMPSPAQLQQSKSKEWRPLSSDKRYSYQILDKGGLIVHDNQMKRDIFFRFVPKEYDLDLSKGVLYTSMWTDRGGNTGEDWTIATLDPDIPSQYRLYYYIMLKAEFSWEGGRIRPGMLTRAPVPTYGIPKLKATPQGIQVLYYPYNVPLQEQASVDVINAVLRDLPRLKQEGL